MKFHPRLAALVGLLFVSSLACAQKQYTNGWINPVDIESIEAKSAGPDNFGYAGVNNPDRHDYITDLRHLGWDILCQLNTVVRAVADGVIVACSPGGWDLDGGHQNYGMMIRSLTASGQNFLVLYAHMIRDKGPDGRLLDDNAIRKYHIGEFVHAGDKLGKIGPYGSMTHLHLGVYVKGTSQAIPKENLGRIKLSESKPTSLLGTQVVGYNDWYDPKTWMHTFRPDNRISAVGNVSYESYMPRVDLTCHWLYRIRKPSGSDNEEITGSDLSGKNPVTIWKPPSGSHIDDYVVLSDDVVVKIHGAPGKFSLYRINQGKSYFIKSPPADFIFARGDSETKGEFVAIFLDESQPTMVVDAANWKYQQINALLYRAGDPLAFLTVPEKEREKERLVRWLIFGVRQNPAAQSKMFVVTGDSAGEHRGWVDTQTECSDATLISEYPAGMSEKDPVLIAFNHLVGGTWIPSIGTLSPIDGDLFLNGFTLTDHRDLKIGSGGPAQIESCAPALQRLLVTVGTTGHRRIGSCKQDGSDLQIIN